MQPGQNLKELRARLGISLREVEEQSQKIAEAQGKPRVPSGRHPESPSTQWKIRIVRDDWDPS